MILICLPIMHFHVKFVWFPHVHCCMIRCYPKHYHVWATKFQFLGAQVATRASEFVCSTTDIVTCCYDTTTLSVTNGYDEMYAPRMNDMMQI